MFYDNYKVTKEIFFPYNVIKIFQNILLGVIFSLWMKVEYALPFLDAESAHRHHPEI